MLGVQLGLPCGEGMYLPSKILVISYTEHPATNVENRGNFYMSKICKFSVNYCDIAILIPIEYNEWAYELATRTQLKLNIDSGLAQNTLTPSPIKHTRCPMNSGTKKRA